MPVRRFTALLALFIPAAAALAQFAGGVNIDFNVTSGAGAGQPSILFGGAASQTGYWNPLNGPYGLGASFTLRNLANSADAVTLIVQSSNSAGSFSFNNPNATGDTGLLLNDIQDVGPSGTSVYSVGPFAGGVYDVYTYAVAPDAAANRMTISVYTTSISTASDVITVGGAIPAGGTLTAGVTHAVHRIAVARGERIFINAHASIGDGSVNGIQIKPVTGYTRLYVKGGTPTGDQTGLSWANACTSLQRALSIAADNPAVTEIWVTRSQHFADDGVLFAPGNREATFSPRSNLSIYGLFNGTESSVAERDLTGPGSATLLDGHTVARHVVSLNGVSGLLIDGANIVAGNSMGLTGDVDGAGVKAVSSTATLSNVRLSGHHALGSGGAMAVSGASNITVSDGDAGNNSAAGGSFLYQLGGIVTINRFSIGGGTASASSAGAIDSRADLRLNNCLIGQNTEPTWVIDASAGTNLTVKNCTIAKNACTAGTNVGLACPNSTTIINCIIWGNTPSSGTPSMSGVLHFNAGATPNITDSIVQQWDGSLGSPGDANLNVDPRFAFSITPGVPPGGERFAFAFLYAPDSRSPARDSGWNGGVPAGTDINKNPRIFDDPFFPNTGFSGGTVDRGCIEAQTPSAVCPGDVGRQGGVEGPDGLRDNNDFVVFIGWFFAPDPRADLGRQGGVAPGDGLFDNNDFVVYINLFFSACP